MSVETQYRVRRFEIHKDHHLFAWCDDLTQKANNLYNAVRFRQRQTMTGLSKEPGERTANEHEVLTEIEAFFLSDPRYEMPTREKWNLSYSLLNGEMKYNGNPDYFAEGLPRQSAQAVIRGCCDEMLSYFRAARAYASDPSKFKERPSLPGYARKGGHRTCKITNQDCVLYEKNGRWEIKLPLIKSRLRGGAAMEGYALKEACVKPDNGIYVISITLEKTVCIPDLPKEPSRIAGIDMGVDNLMAVTNNIGKSCILYKGGILKSINRNYNRKIAKTVSEQTLRTGSRFVPTPQSMDITLRRNDQVRDIMHKTAKHFVSWCVDNRIDTIVTGVNAGIKQNISIGHVNDQNFVQIPFDMLRKMIKYLAEEKGMRYIEQEESYTSKASFPGRDLIPTYGEDDDRACFSGKRGPHRYKGTYSAGGFRGLYMTDDGAIINSDLNASANIIRKAVPEAIDKGSDVCFDDVKIIVHPDSENRRLLRERQLEKNSGISRSRQNRLKKKRMLPA